MHCKEMVLDLSQKECLKIGCPKHLLFEGLHLNPDKIQKTEKYFDCLGCQDLISDTWHFTEIGKLYGMSKQHVYYLEQSALKKLKKILQEGDAI